MISLSQKQISINSELNHYINQIKTTGAYKSLSSINHEQDQNNIQPQNLGLEFRVKNAKEFIKQLLETGYFLPEEGLTKQQKLDYKLIFGNIDDLDNNRNLGTVVGMTLFGFVGFVAVGFTIFGAIGGAGLGSMVGRYTGNKISKKIYTKNGQISEFKIFTIRVLCLVRWLELQMIKYKFNLNVKRFAVERLLCEIKPLFHYKYFRNDLQKKSVKLLNQVKEVLIKIDATYALAVTYKLSIEFVKILDKEMIYSKFSKNDVEYMLSHTVNNVLRPLHSLFQDDKQHKKHTFMKSLIEKINHFVTTKRVLEVIRKYEDQQLTIEYIKVFSEKMKQVIKVDDLEKYLKLNQYKDLKDLGIPQFQTSEMINSVSQIKQHSQIVVRRNSLTDLRQPQLQIEQSNRSIKSFRAQSMHSIKINKVENNNLIKIDQCEPLQQLIGDEQPELSSIFEPIQSPIKQIIFKPDLRYSDELENKFKQFLEIINEPIETWEPVLQKPGLVIVKTFKTGNSAVFVKGYTDIETTKEILFKAIYDQEFRVYWDKVLMDFHIVEKESDDVDIVYYYVESPFGVANRDFCQKRIVRRNFPQKGQDSLMYFSCENKSAPVIKKFVRAQTLISGYIMEDLQDRKGVRLYFVSNNDVKGNIPKSIVNFVATRASVKWFTSLKNACLDHDKFLKSQEKQQQQQQSPMKKFNLMKTIQ